MKKKTEDKVVSIIKAVRCKLIWITACGQKVVLSEMTDNHLQNSIIYLEERIAAHAKWKVGNCTINGLLAEEWVEVLRDELKYRMDNKIFKGELNLKY